MTEEPRLNEALQKLMLMLDDEVLNALVVTGYRQLDASVVAEAEESLEQVDLARLDEPRREARNKVEAALYEWLEATANWLHSN